MPEDVTALPDIRQVDLRTLVGHAESVQSNATVEEVQAVFARKAVEFIAVADGHDLLGVCARRDVSQRLSSRYGFALFAQKPVTAVLHSSSLRVSRSTALEEVFLAASARDAVEFFDDVVLVDDHGRYLGMIPMRTLVRLQTQFLVQHNAELQASRAEIVAKNQAIQQDLAMAREVQLALLPPAQAPIVAGGRSLAIAQRFRAAGEMSGDFFEVLRIADRAVGILVCDVMGHGTRSALITAMARAIIEELRPVAGDPGEFLTRLNRDLTRILRRTGALIFVTAAYVVIDLEAAQLRYAQAGHPPPLWCGPGDRAWTRIAGGPEHEGPALGLIDDFGYSFLEKPLEPGSRLLMFTDGLTEAANGKGEEFGLERLTQSLEQVHARPLDAVLDHVLAAAARFSGDSLGDDICLVAAELTSAPSGAPKERQRGFIPGVGAPCRAKAEASLLSMASQIPEILRLRSG